MGEMTQVTPAAPGIILMFLDFSGGLCVSGFGSGLAQSLLTILVYLLPLGPPLFSHCWVEPTLIQISVKLLT